VREDAEQEGLGEELVALDRHLAEAPALPSSMGMVMNIRRFWSLISLGARVGRADVDLGIADDDVLVAVAPVEPL